MWRLRISCANVWPGLIRECVETLEAIRPDHKVGTVERVGCTEVYADWKHWPCLFPQHGLGMKHTRKIELVSWQCAIVDLYTEDFVRGLFHSDGCRFINRVKRQAGGKVKSYEYPRYMFTNTSRDILELAGFSLDQLGVEWRMASATNLSVAQRDAVERLDSFIGPKY